MDTKQLLGLIRETNEQETSEDIDGFVKDSCEEDGSYNEIIPAVCSLTSLSSEVDVNRHKEEVIESNQSIYIYNNLTCL